MGLGPLFFARAIPCRVPWCSDCLSSPIFGSFFDIPQLRGGGVAEFEAVGGVLLGSSVPGELGGPRLLPRLWKNGRSNPPHPPRLIN